MFLHVLALRMGRTVSELSESLSMDELARWMAFDRRSPIADERLDLMIANLCLTVCQSSGAKKRSGGAFKLDDFLLFKKAAKTPKEFMRSMFGDRVVKKPRKGS